MYAIGATVEGILRAVVRSIRNRKREGGVGIASILNQGRGQDPQESAAQDTQPPANFRMVRSPATWLLLVLITVAAAFTPSRMVWQAEQAASIGATANPNWVAVVALTLALVLLLIYLGRLIRRFANWLGRKIGGAKISHGKIKNPTILGLIGAAAATVLAAVLVLVLFGVSLIMFNSVNNSTVAGAAPPESPTRSGSPESLIPWQSLGQLGRIFVDQGPNPAEITSVTRQAAKEPIRIYSGIESADSFQAQADLALADLKRSGGLNRSHIILYTPSDSGTVDATAASAAEYITNGDIASVAMQYSVLPSFLSYALAQSNSQEAGTVLFNTIHQAIQELPPASRPKLYVYGESLGAYGSQEPFTDGGIPGLVDKVAGALWVGPPSASTFWNQLNQQATGGTPWQPVVAGGTVVRFAADESAITTSDANWGQVRALYLQNATDPVVWWPGTLLTTRPAWLDSPRGPGVPEQMTWLPVVTFEQVLMDLPFAMAGPQGTGHNYAELVGPAWTKILMPANWSPEKAAALQRALG